MELQKTREELAPTFEDRDFLKQLAQVNLLTSYPIQDAYLEAWLVSIKELTPEMTPKMLKKIIDSMKIGRIKYDHRKGVQNIFDGFKVVLTDYANKRAEVLDAKFGSAFDRDESSEEFKQYEKESKRIWAILDRFNKKFRGDVHR